MTSEEKVGWASGFLAYALWGVFPLYFILFARSGALEIVAHRVLWSFVFCLVVLVATGRLSRSTGLWRDRRTALRMAAAGVLITTNWGLYVLGVTTGRTLEAALGYFINPLAAVALAMVVFKERLRPLQWTALGFGVLAVVVMVVAYGEVPWIAPGLAASFAGYSTMKKLVGAEVPPVEGLAFETAVVLPLAIGHITWLGARGDGTLALDGYGLLLTTTGIVTAVPLLLFARGARTMPMVGIAMLQYQTPAWQFLIGWLILTEPMPAARWAGFVLVWIAIVIFATDVLVSARDARRRRRAARLGATARKDDHEDGAR